MVSVIIPSYNRAKTIKQSIMSVLKQSYTDIEVIVVDDCSTDNTAEIVKMISDKRIKYIHHSKKQGACAARNTGINYAQGEYIAFQDSDDIWKGNKLQIQMKVLKDKKTDVVFSAINRHNYGRNPYKFPTMLSGEKSEHDIVMGFYASTQTIVGKREVFEQYKFDTEIARMQDYDLMVRVSRNKKIYYVDLPLVDVFLQEDSITTKNTDKHKKIVEISNVLLKKYPDLIKKYPDWEIEMLKRIGHGLVMQGKSGVSIYKDIFTKESNCKNFLRVCLAEVRLLKMFYILAERKKDYL